MEPKLILIIFGRIGNELIIKDLKSFQLLIITKVVCL